MSEISEFYYHPIKLLYIYEKAANQTYKTYNTVAVVYRSSGRI